MSESNKDKIEKVLNGLFEKNRFVFWYNEGGEMKDFATALTIRGVEFLALDSNAFTVKYHILKGEQPERGWLIYSAHERPTDEDNWLLDLEVQGTLFSADMASLWAAECGIPLELKEKVVDAHYDFFKLADNRRRITPRLRQGMDVEVIKRQMMAVVCKADPTCDQLTWALAQEALDGGSDMTDKMEKYHLNDVYWTEVEQVFGYHQEHAVKTLLIVLFREDMDRYLTSPTLTNEAHIFMRDWRDSRQYGQLYKDWANKLEAELGIKTIVQGEPIERLVAIETFPCIDKIIAQYLQRNVLDSTMTVDDMETIVDEREHKIFFPVAAHTIYALLEARRMMEEIDQKMTGLIINSPEEGFKLYAQSLYSIDLHYRHYIREARQAESTNLLPDVTTMVQNVYTNSYLMQLAKKWQPLVDSMDKWHINNVISQRHFYQYHVSPFVERGVRVFVIISDALRYETMVELEQRIAQANRMVTYLKDPMLSTLPSYTQLGMAALLPHKVLSYEKNQDTVYADGMSTAGTDTRKKVLLQYVPKSMAITAEDLLLIEKPRNYFKDYDLIYIYSNHIDQTGDKKATEHEVFEATETEFDQIVKLVKFISSGNGSNILITADHGYIYQNEELDESDFTDFKAMGDYFIENRRFVIGPCLTEGDAVKTWNSENVGLKEGMQMQTCKGLNRIRKQGSGSRFVHGGSMPQEVVVPVLHVNVKKDSDVGNVDVDVLNKRSRLTTNKQTISFYQTDVVTEKQKALVLRIGFYDSQNELISDTVTLTFDSENPDSVQREQKHAFVFKNQLSKLNHQEVILKMEKQLVGTDQFAPYKQEAYKVSVMFNDDF
ncbi:BREX-1 system phosphatase PglZ type A [Prevotella brunnea]|uniref:BREX-1 system phosphatase PglZ type A n=1 Tax=Prevotella brunnea TaxID=2508867 RepID=A0A5C8GBI2_9BACT|nr:BREX-1 system phosphatase PglZ type A [Prevotella brunnea]MDR0185432.1 BREX-1 system phosphatase PglZ type A [Prevotella brunnea]TXJ59159.1 BREX-1 system phosphatase PglZ type A [Prevotella brunnea]